MGSGLEGWTGCWQEPMVNKNICTCLNFICALCVWPAQVFDGAVIVLSLAPMVASTVANGPSSPWDAISLIITLRIWRVKRIIDGEAGRGWGLMSPASCPLLSGHRDRYRSELSAVSATFNLQVYFFLFFFIIFHHER